MEFHAIILCGPGKQLTPFSKVRSTGVPKALMPLAGKPMVEYVLNWCEKAFFNRVTIMCDDASAEEIESFVKEFQKKKSLADSSSRSGSEGDLQRFANSISVTKFAGASSGEIFQFLYKGGNIRAGENFVLLPCDFITNLPPQVLIEAFRCRDDTDMGVLIYYRNTLDIEDKKNKVFPKNYTLYAELPTGKSQFLDYYSTDDVNFHKGFKIRTQLMWSRPKTIVSTKLLNSSIFFGNSEQIFKVFSDSPDKFTESYFSSRPLIKVIRDLARKEWQSPNCNHTVGFFVTPDEANFLRANTLPAYMEANRAFLKVQARENAGGKTSATKDKSVAIIGADAMVGENTVAGEKTNVKRSVVGANCNIGKRVKLTGSIIFDNVTIENDVQLENTIVGRGAQIQSKSKLTNCFVESTHEVAKGTQSKGDTLLCLTLEGLVESAVDTSSSGSDDTDESFDEYDEEIGDNSDGLFGY